MDRDRTYTSFAGDSLVFTGPLEDTLRRTKERLDGGETAPVLIFDDQTGAQVDFDLRGTADEVLERLSSHPLFASSDAAKAARSGPGRPKLGVVSREVTLLPRHWEWLEQQPQGISAALRRIVDEARKREPDWEKARRARDAAGKFMWTMAGNLPGFEEASRALFAADQKRLEGLIGDWPADIRTHLFRLLGKTQGVEAKGKPTA